MYMQHPGTHSGYMATVLSLKYCWDNGHFYLFFKTISRLKNVFNHSIHKVDIDIKTSPKQRHNHRSNVVYAVSRIAGMRSILKVSIHFDNIYCYNIRVSLTHIFNWSHLQRNDHSGLKLWLVSCDLASNRMAKGPVSIILTLLMSVINWHHYVNNKWVVSFLDVQVLMKTDIITIYCCSHWGHWYFTIHMT